MRASVSWVRILKHLLEAEKWTFLEELSFQMSESIHQGSNREQFLIADGEEILLCKSNKRIKVAQIIPNRYVFYILKISADLFGNLALTLSAQCLRIRAQE
jgi:hypothetical protein